jgi:hypothetical protein
MRVPQHPTQIRRSLEARLKKLTPAGPVLAASLAQIAKRCGRPTCHCANGTPHTAYHLTYKDQGKSRTVYVPLDLVEEVRSWIDNHRRLKRLLKEISDLTLALVQGHVQHQKRRRGRP